MACAAASATHSVAHFKLGGTLHVDVSGVRYDGPSPGIARFCGA